MNQPYTTRKGVWCDEGNDEWTATDALYAVRRSIRDAAVPCLVVTGDLDAAERRLAPIDDAAIERAARAMRAWDADLGTGPWETLPAGMRKAWCDLARVALVVAEETPRG